MTRKFEKLTREEFVALIANYPVDRKITDVHLHHTWKPRQTDYDEADGERTILAMWRYHTKTRGFADIAQHVIVAPDGAIWLGRSFDRPPASAAGFNGTSTAGPFMIEMIGDFDSGRETPTTPQMKSTIMVIRAVQERFGLPTTALRFHSEMSGKTCPGDAMKKDDVIDSVEKVELPKNRSAGIFGPNATRINRIIRFAPPDDGREDRAPAELDHGAMSEMRASGGQSATRGFFSSAERKARIARWRDHWISLEGGHFSDSGALRSTQTDVDRIFSQRIPAAIEQARKRGERLRLMIYAHGGLASERAGIDGMLAQIETWDDNGVYPLFFVWETAVFPSLIDGITRGATRGARGAFTDRLSEAIARHAGGRIAWQGMKASARNANTGDGGAHAVNRSLRKLAATAGDDLSINLIGHSAGAIFHAYFVEDSAEAAQKLGPAVDNLILLAPAIRTDEFANLVLPRMKGRQIKRSTIFTMNDALERMDPTVPAYSKSLLYLIRRALEPENEADLLGLEISLRSDAKLASTFGLNGAGGKHSVVFSGDPGTDSPEAENRGRASASRTHGDFDNDAATMNSALRLVLGKTNGEPIVPFPRQPGQRATADEILADRLPDDLREELSDRLAALSSRDKPSHPAPAVTSIPIDRRKRALCIGIDNYRGLGRLGGCTADATIWAAALRERGYSVDLMREEDATGAGMHKRIREFLGPAKPGDNLVLQFAGHGVGFRDTSGDEADAQDEAMCGIDFNQGDPGFVLDDELRAIYGDMPPWVEVTAFIDCCHSGTMSRMAIASRSVGAPHHAGLRARHADRIGPIAMDAYRQRAGRLSREVTAQRGIHFGACRDMQLANESAGQGHFTRAAIAALSQGGKPTNAEFMERIVSLMEPYPIQTPVLDTAKDLRSAPFAPLQ